jgi:pimeloyl-ACP methyl ester carboxylesterase
MPEVKTDLLIRYRVLGEGPPVLWHTGGCGDGRMWELAGYIDGVPGYAHVLMDHRGHGESESPPDLAGHHMERYVDDVVAVLDDVGAEKAAFVGYSLGARVGYAVAMAHPDRLRGLVALDSLPEPEEDHEELSRNANDVLDRGVRALMAEMAAEEGEPPPDWLMEHLCETSDLGLAGAWEAFATTPDFWAAAPTLDVPALLLMGVGPDDADWWKLAQQLAGVLPHGDACAIPGAQHLAAFHRTDLSVPPICEFLAKHAGGPSDRVRPGSGEDAPTAR